MKIKLDNLGKRFNREWIFRHLTYEFNVGKSYAITGSNGSGKSTLLQVIAGYSIHNEGKISYVSNDQIIPPEKIFSQIGLAAPYLELIEELTLKEFLSFHQKLKPFLGGFTINTIVSIVSLQDSLNKEIRYFSSGMKQRLKLAQAFFSDVKILLLDEPCTNLDQQGIDLYRRLIEEYGKSRLIIISSNDKVEYDFCSEIIDMRNILPPIS